MKPSIKTSKELIKTTFDGQKNPAQNKLKEKAP
jgi:hypothetical protein